MFAKQLEFYTHQQYFNFEEQADYKHEYYQGQIIAMAGASANHNRISLNAANALSNALEEDNMCEVFMSDLRVRIDAKDRFTYPDVMVVCGKLDFFENRTDTITNPKVIIEVLSASTEKVDRTEKFHAYWSIPNFEAYILIDQYQVRVEYFRRMSDKEWGLRVFTKLDEMLELRSIGVEVKIERLYRNVVWEEEQDIS